MTNLCPDMIELTKNCQIIVINTIYIDKKLTTYKEKDNAET